VGKAEDDAAMVAAFARFDADAAYTIAVAAAAASEQVEFDDDAAYAAGYRAALLSVAAGLEPPGR